MRLGWLLAIALPFIAAGLFALLGCSAAQPVTDAATCSPKADAWHHVELALVCAGKIVPDECPEAAELRARYLELEAAECSKAP